MGISRRYSHQRAATLVNGSIDEPLPLLRYFALRRRGSQKYRPQFPIQRATAHSLSIQVHQNYSIIYIEKVSLSRYTKSKAKRDQKKPSKPTNKGGKRSSKSASKLDLFELDAQNLENTKANLKKISAMMEEKGYDVPPYNILHNALQEAHEKKLKSAYNTAVYVKWASKTKNSKRQLADSEDDSSKSDGSQEDDMLVRAHGREVDASNDDRNNESEEEDEDLFTLLLLFSLFAFCVAETEENYATMKGKSILLLADQ